MLVLAANYVTVTVQLLKLILHLFRFVADCCGFVVRQIRNKSNKWNLSFEA